MTSQEIKLITRRMNANAGAAVYTEAQVKVVLDRYERLRSGGKVVSYVHGTADAQDVVWTLYKSIWGASATSASSWEFKFVSAVMQEWYYFPPRTSPRPARPRPSRSRRPPTVKVRRAFLPASLPGPWVWAWA